MDAQQYDIVLMGKTLCVVLAQHEGALVVHPKYQQTDAQTHWTMLGKHWERISNPFDTQRNSEHEIGLERIGKDYLLREKPDTHYRIFSPQLDLTNPHLVRTKRLMDMVAAYVPIGLTGSGLLGWGKEGFSDIDLIVPASAFAGFSEALRGMPIYQRTQEEWREFYRDYDVRCGLDDLEFAEHMAGKPNQFIFEGTPVSVFFVPRQPPKYMPQRDDPANFQDVCAIIDASSSMTLPGSYTVRCDGEMLRVLNNERAYLNQAGIGEQVMVRGFKYGNDVHVREASRDVIKRIPCVQSAS